MHVTVREEGLSCFPAYGAIPVTFRVDRKVRIVRDEAGSVRLHVHNEPLASPFIKDYDVIAGNAPSEWGDRFNLAACGILAARIDDTLVGGAIVAPPALGLVPHPPSGDLATLWDLRVHPATRRAGVGSALFAAALRWATGAGHGGLCVETQDINVAACRFYERQGCVLVSVDPKAYPDLPEEVQLIWIKHDEVRARAS